MTKVYVVIDVETGSVALPHGYMNARDAKIAMKCHKSHKSWPKFAVACVESVPTIVSTVNERGEWVSVI